MSLPLSRNTTYGPDAQILSNDLNDIQDKIVALHDGVRRVRTVTIVTKTQAPALTTFSFTGSLGATFQIPVEIGMSIVAYRTWVRGPVANEVRANIVRETYGTTGISVVSGTETNISDTTGDPQMLSKTGLTLAIASGFAYGIKVDLTPASAGGDITIDGIEVDYLRIP